MRAPPTRKIGRAPGKSSTATARQLIGKSSTPEREIVENLQRILADLDSLPMPRGKLGCAYLDALELVDKIRTREREKARTLLLEEPTAIPCWRASEDGPSRELSRDTRKVFEALSKSFELSAEDFLTACSTSFSGLRKLIARWNPGMTNEEIESELDCILSDLTGYRKGPVRLVRLKGGQLELPLE